MITRDNYEEFFLLYVDNELSAADRELVLRFVAGHPDLEEEWQALLQCRIEPGQILFPGKETLMKGEEEEIWPEKLFEPDMSIVFPGKESLYRKEKDRGVFLLPWWRVAAAAVILLLTGAYLFQHSRDDDHQKPAVSAVSVPVKKNSLAVTPATTPALYPSEHTEQKSTVPANAVAKTTGHQKNTQPDEHLIATADPGKVATLTTDPRQIAAVTTGSERTVDVIADPGRGADPGKTIAVVSPSVTADDHVISREQSSFATQALLDNATASLSADTDNKDNDNDNAGTEPVSTRKNKLRGIFRRVSRAFEKTADRDDEGQRKVLIGAFQFALK